MPDVNTVPVGRTPGRNYSPCARSWRRMVRHLTCVLVLPACWCFQAPVARHPRATLHSRAAVSASAADFSGSWQMDLGASDALGPVLREMQLNRVLAALVSRLSVSQTIRQDADKVCVTVKTRLSTDELELRLDGALTKLPGLSGGLVDAASRWLDDARLETRQHLIADAPGRPDAPDADAFVTVARSHARQNLALSQNPDPDPNQVRSLHDGGDTLWEEVCVYRRGAAVPAASARRVLRRVS